MESINSIADSESKSSSPEIVKKRNVVPPLLILLAIIILLTGVIVLRTRTNHIVPLEFTNYRSINAWCMNSPYWFHEESCESGYASDGPVNIYITKQGEYKGSCGWEDNSCRFRSCGATSENICLKNKTIDYCKKITDKYKKTSCYKLFAEKNHDASACDNLAGNLKDGCLSDTAGRLEDVTFCRNIEDTGIKNYCILSNKKQSKDCEIHTDQFEKDKCLDDFYLQFQDENIKILNEALAKNDISMCSKQIGRDAKEICLLRFAIKDKNKKICPTLTVEQFKQECNANP
ncbi:MAG: hypothetical protein ABIO02_02070 [Patescibacteria group bacterium]